MAQACNHTRFTLKARVVNWISINKVAHDLYGYFTVERGMLTEIYFCHAAARDELADLNFT